MAFLSLTIGLRFIQGHRCNSMLSLTSIISVIGIALGVSVLIIGLSAMNGFECELNKRVLAVIPHSEIESVNQPWKKWKEDFKAIENIPNITAEPYINFIGLIENGSNFDLIQIKGINPQQEKHLSNLPSFVKDNAWIKFKAGKQQIIIGKGIADKLKIKQGDWISLMISNVRCNYKLNRLKQKYLRVIGILQLGGIFDHNFAIVPIEDARQYLDIGDSITGIAIRVHDAFNVDKVIKEASKTISSYVYIKSWIETYSYMYRDLKTIKAIIYLSMLLVIGISCFNMISMLLMSIRDKRNDIAILRTLGAKDSIISTIFIWYGLLIGLTGSLCGLMIGIIISLHLTSIFNKIEKLIGHQLLSGNIYFIDFLPSELRWCDVIYVLVTSLLISLIASWYPARRANYIDPINILTNRK